MTDIRSVSSFDRFASVDAHLWPPEEAKLNPLIIRYCPCRLDVQSVLQFDALLLLHQGYLAMDLRSGHRPPPSPPLADCRSEQVNGPAAKVKEKLFQSDVNAGRICTNESEENSKDCF
jgi:hypothetical protein